MAAPTLLMTGERSPAYLLRLSDRLQQLLPNAERVEIAGASHGMTREPGAVNEAILGFLAHAPRNRSGDGDGRANLPWSGPASAASGLLGRSRVPASRPRGVGRAGSARRTEAGTGIYLPRNATRALRALVFEQAVLEGAGSSIPRHQLLPPCRER